MTTNAGTTAGLPVSGAQHTIATTPTDVATIDFTNTTVTPAATDVTPANDQVVWQKTITVGSKDVNLSSMRFRQLGSVMSSDLQNFRLYVDGTQVGSAVTSADLSNYVTFTFSPAVVVKTGSRVVKLVADVVGGSSRTYQFSLRQAADIEAIDSQFGVPVLARVSSTVGFSTMDAGIQTVLAGTITITKTTDSPSGNVVNAGSGVTLAKFTVKAQGEKLKVENLRVSHSASDATWTKIRSGALFANGVQVGSIADINEDNQTPTYTQFNLGSALIVEPGKDVLLRCVEMCST